MSYTVCKGNARFDAFKSKARGEGSYCRMLSLEETFPMAELSSVGNFISSLQNCRRERNLAQARQLYAHICNTGQEAHRAVGNYIVPMFVDCGSVLDAQQVFNKLVYRNERSWSSIIFGYIQCGQSQHAFNLYQKMLDDNVRPSRYTFMALLKACVKLKDVERGRKVHVEIIQKGLDADTFVRSALVDMYAKCGAISEARKLLNKLPVRNVVSWTALIAGYVEHGSSQEALKCFEQMQMEGISPDAVTFTCILKACGSVGAIDKGRELHWKITQRGFDTCAFVGSTLVDMYAKCGSLSEALEVFGKLPVRDVVTWTSLIRGYAEHGPVHEALNCFEKMKLEGISPNAVTFVCALKACGIIGAIDKGREIHASITQGGFERDPFIRSALVDMYAKCGSLSEAREVFGKLPVRDVVSWTSLIAGYAEYGPGHEAVKCFEQMRLEGFTPDAVTFVCCLKACGSIGAIDKAREIHSEITQKGFERNIFIGNALIFMYGKCGLLSEAQKVFDRLPIRDVLSWTALVAGYTEHGSGEEVLKCFEGMQQEGVSPSAAIFIRILKACGNMGAINKGRDIHTMIIQKGYAADLFVGSTLVNMYAKCGSLLEAQEVFDNLPVRDVVTWNVLIAGYMEHGHSQEAIKCFQRMQLDGMSPNAVTFVCMLKACASIGAIDKGREIHMAISKKGFEKDLFIGTSLVDMYAKCGSLLEAQDVFDNLPIRNVVSWTALVAGYAEHGSGQEALKYFEQMQVEGISPNGVTFVCSLKACGSIGAIDKGREIHAEIMQRQYEGDLFVGNSLVDMYAKCGSLLEAYGVFVKMPVRDVVSWNVMINGYGINHDGIMALQCFEEMQEQGVQPNDITFTCLLNACTRACFILKAQEYFQMMREIYGIVPTKDHYICMVDLAARSELFCETKKFLEATPCSHL